MVNEGCGPSVKEDVCTGKCGFPCRVGGPLKAVEKV